MTVYVPIPGASEDGDSSSANDSMETDLEWGPNFVRVNIGERHTLHLPNLHDEITAAKVAQKPGKLVVTLTKKDAVSWWELLKK